MTDEVIEKSKMIWKPQRILTVCYRRCARLDTVVVCPILFIPRKK